MQEKNVLAIIPARAGGSKGIPGKNIRQFAGKPLMAHSIEAASKCSLITRTVVSTDEDKIAEISNDAHVKKELSKIPETSIIDWNH